MSEGKVKEYSNEEITVIWKPDLCIHSGECVKNSPEVFKPDEKPWITPENSTSKQIMETVDKCPSGALSYRVKDESVSEQEGKTAGDVVKITAMKDGPLLVDGVVEIKDSAGEIKSTKGRTAALCRCGASSSKPFCDGSHTDVDFEG